MRTHGPFAAIALFLALMGGCGGGGMALSSCATKAIPDYSAAGAFDVDTGLSSASGAAYGSASCANQYLVEVDLAGAAFQGKDRLVVSGFWSSTEPAQPCNYRATMNVFVLDGMSWREWDLVNYLGDGSGGVCSPRAQSHTDDGSLGLDSTNIPLTNAFVRARVAVNATDGTSDQAVAVVGQIF